MDYNNLDYDKMCTQMKRLVSKYPFVGRFSIGKSVMGRDLWCLRLGKGARKVFACGAHHALEWITSSFLMSFAEDYADCLREEDEFCGCDILDLYQNATYYIVPMVNPDGVDIVLNKPKKNHPYYKSISDVLPVGKLRAFWQSNINGVDLNHNYDAGFLMGKKKAEDAGICEPNYTRYSGEAPFCEPETKAIKTFCERERFDVSVAFHTQGEVIYYDYNGKVISQKLAQRLSEVSGYPLDKAEGVASYSGFKDWMIDKLNTPSFTIEAGRGKNPLKYSQLEKIKTPCCNIMAELGNFSSL